MIHHVTVTGGGALGGTLRHRGIKTYSRRGLLAVQAATLPRHTAAHSAAKRRRDPLSARARYLFDTKHRLQAENCIDNPRTS